MNWPLAMQVASSLMCAVAIWLNLKQAMKWRRLSARLRPVCKVIMHAGERQLGIVGSLPEPGTVLYRMDEPKEHKAPL